MENPTTELYDLYDLDASEFPCMCGFRELTNSLSNAAQSAPGCASEFTLEKWQAMEDVMAKLTASDFVMMATGWFYGENTDLSDQLMEEHFPGWLKEWE